MGDAAAARVAAGRRRGGRRPCSRVRRSAAAIPRGSAPPLPISGGRWMAARRSQECGYAGAVAAESRPQICNVPTAIPCATATKSPGLSTRGSRTLPPLHGGSQHRSGRTHIYHARIARQVWATHASATAGDNRIANGCGLLRRGACANEEPRRHRLLGSSRALQALRGAGTSGRVRSMRHSGLGALRMTDHAITPAKPSSGSVPKNGQAQLRRTCMRPFNLRLPLLGPSAP